MLGQGDELLRKLASGARPDGVRPRLPRAALDSMGFASLLDASTRLNSDQPITLSERLDIELSDEVRQRLGRVADRSAQMGLKHIIAVVDAGVVAIDTGSRTVAAHLNDQGDEPVVGFDGIAVLTGDQSNDRLFGVGLHGPRPTPRERDNQARFGSPVAGANEINAGWSDSLIALIAGLENGRERPDQDQQDSTASRE